MSWRIACRHHTFYRYAGPAYGSYNEVRISPLTTPRQTVLDAEVVVDPSVSCLRYWDYWGTLVHSFDVHDQHLELQVTGTSVTEVDPPPPPPEPVSWDRIRSAEVADEFAELLMPTAFVPLERHLVRHAREAIKGLDPYRASLALADWTRRELTYESGATAVSTSAPEALRMGRGVCQDFAHVHLALLRSVGIPARYVSGYLHPQAQPKVGVTTEAESHAWVDAWVGDWVAIDPTNVTTVGASHVTVARGRDYADVPPIRGVYQGGAVETLEVKVEMTRLA